MILAKNQKGISLIECVIACFIMSILLPVITHFLIQFTSVVSKMQEEVALSSEMIFVDTIMRRDLAHTQRVLLLDDNNVLIEADESILYHVKEKRLQRQYVAKVGRYVSSLLHYELLTLNQEHCLELQSSRKKQMICH